MTCYFRHLTKIFAEAGITPTAENKEELDKKIHELVKITYKACPATWKEVKKRIADDEEGFTSALREAWSKRK